MQASPISFVFTDRIFVFYLESGTISALAYATTLMLTIPAVIGVADYFLSLYSEKTSIDVKTIRINNMFSFVILIGIPSMYILFLKGDLIVSILFERGNFTSNSTQMVNLALVPLSFMIIPLLVQKAIDQIFQVENKVSIVLIRTLLGLF